MASAPELERVGGHYFDDSNISVPLTDYASDPKVNNMLLFDINAISERGKTLGDI